MTRTDPVHERKAYDPEGGEDNPRDGDPLMDAPATATWEELKENVKEVKEWAQTVCVWDQGRHKHQHTGQRKTQE